MIEHLGMNIEAGWSAYLIHNMLFVKSFAFDPAATYPDNGSNFETYSDETIMELETLGPLTTLAPTQSLEHVETWRIITDVPPDVNTRDIDHLANN